MLCSPALTSSPQLSITSPHAVREFRAIINRHPWVINVVETLRVTDIDRQMHLQETERAPALTPLGEDWAYIFSQKYAQLKALELPPLYGYQQWPTLSQPIREAMVSLFHHHQLEEVSITTHYPLEIISPCLTIRRLERRIYPDMIPDLKSEQSASTSLYPIHHHSAGPALKLHELIIQDPCDLASSFTPQLVDPKSGLDLTTLQCLTYYGDTSPSTQLSTLLAHCGSTLSTLELYIGGDDDHSFLHDIPILPRLSHVTFIVDSVRRSSLRFDSVDVWLVNTVSLRILDGYMRQHDHPLQSVHIIIRTGPGVEMPDAFKQCWKVIYGFCVLFKVARNHAGFSAHGDLLLRCLRSFRVSAALDKKTWDLIHLEQPPPDLEFRVEPPREGTHTHDECMEYIVGIAVMDFIEDDYDRWPVFPKDERALA
ncbi:hypothetical protein NMY22_g19250 [Coprinellus aureogranulatus]|nr:hypothetical protein NMY22_g19250 [Coprinellus aureogranulatus]